MSNLSPYDTGEILEPKLWVYTGNAASLDLAINPHAAEKRARMGKVDFDAEDGHTMAIVRGVRNEAGGYDIEVYDFNSGETTIVEVGNDP